MTVLPFPYTTFTGGLNSKDGPYELEDTTGESPDLLNVQGTTAGAIVKRNGLLLLEAPGGTSIYGAQGFSPPVLFVAGSGTNYQVNTPPSSTATLASGFMANHNWSFVEVPSVGGGAGTTVLGIDGDDTPQRYAFLTVSTWVNTSGGVGVPNGRYALYHNNQVFVAGTKTYPSGGASGNDPLSRLYWSAIGDPYNWDPASLTGAGFIDLDPSDGQEITGLGTVGPYILVAKDRKLFVLVDPATATVRKLSDSVGCNEHRSIASGPEGTFFMSNDRGVYVTNGSKLTPISDKILPSITKFGMGVNAGAYFNAHYYLATTDGFVYDFDAVLSSWWKHSIPVRQFAQLSGNLYAIDDATGRVSQLFTGTDDYGAAIPWHWFAPWQSPSFYRRRRFPTPYYRKRLRQVRIDGYGNMNFNVGYDFDANANMPAVAVASNIFNYTSGTPPVARARFNSLGVANVFQMRFSGSDTNPAAMYSYALMMHDRVDQVT